VWIKTKIPPTFPVEPQTSLNTALLRGNLQSVLGPLNTPELAGARDTRNFLDDFWTSDHQMTLSLWSSVAFRAEHFVCRLLCHGDWNVHASFGLSTPLFGFRIRSLYMTGKQTDRRTDGQES